MAQQALSLGEALPRFTCRSSVNPRFAFDTVAGRYVAVAFLPDGALDAASRRAVEQAAGRGDVFDDVFAALFVVTPPGDDAPELGEVRRLHDDEGRVRTIFGAVGADGSARAAWVVLDPNLRLLMLAPLHETERVLAYLRELPPVERYAGTTVWAPVLLVPYVFEPELCRELIGLYEASGGAPSGFMREVDGKTRLLHDPSHKRRRDVIVEDPRLCAVARARVTARLLPEIAKAFQFKATRMERYLVACYSAEEGGFFRRHRDNTTAGTAHRRFAVTINLNAEEYEGGDLRFPEFGPRTYRAPTGAAVVFSCSLLHEATPVIAGRRYAFLPFLYDEAAAQIRQANLEHVDLGAP